MDGLSWMMQIAMFFLLGLLSFPSRLPYLFLPGSLIALAITVIARPAAIFLILSFFKYTVKEKLFVSFVGLRGAASIVFAIMAVTATNETLPYDLFHIVFFVALFSILIQGSFVPLLARRLNVIDTVNPDAIYKTFTDYEPKSSPNLLEYRLKKRISLSKK